MYLYVNMLFNIFIFVHDGKKYQKNEEDENEMVCDEEESNSSRSYSDPMAAAAATVYITQICHNSTKLGDGYGASINEENVFTASSRSMSNLKVQAHDSPAKKEGASKTFSSNMCSICLDHYEDGDEVCSSRNDCGHGFHLECIMGWLLHNEDCPLCRSQFLVPVAQPDDGSAGNDHAQTTADDEV